MGACALTNRTDGVTTNGKRYVEFDVAPSSSYATGGDSVSLATVGLKVVDAIYMVGSVGTPTGKEVRTDITDPTAPKVLVYTGANTQATAATDQSGAARRFRFIGS